MNILRVVLSVLVMLIVAGCAASPSNPVEPTQIMPPAPTATAANVESPAENAAPPAFAFETDELRVMAQKAVEDLAKRLSVPAVDVVVMEAAAVNWPDSSLGCPGEGMMYAQMITPGYRVVLKVGETLYEYHAGADANAIFCEKPQPPVNE